MAAETKKEGSSSTTPKKGLLSRVGSRNKKIGSSSIEKAAAAAVDNLATNSAKVPAKSKFQAAGLAVGAAAKREKEKQRQQQEEEEAQKQQQQQAEQPKRTAATLLPSHLLGGTTTFAVNKAATKSSPKKRNITKEKEKSKGAVSFSVSTIVENDHHSSDNNMKTTTMQNAAKSAVSPTSKFRAAAFAVNGHVASSNGDDDDDTAKENNNNNNNNALENDEWAKLAYAAKIAALAAKNQRASKNEKLYHRMVISAYTWEVWSPPPANSVSGKLVPKIINQHKFRRKVSLEIHRVTPIMDDDKFVPQSGESNNKNKKKKNDDDDDEERLYSYHEAVLRMLVPETKELSRQYKIEAIKKMRTNEGSAASSGSTRQIVTSADDDVDDDDDESLNSTSSTSSKDASSKYYQLADNGGKDYQGWKGKYSIPMYGIYIRNHRKKRVQFLISFNDFKQERELIFDTLDDRRLFMNQIEKQKKLEEERQDERLQYALDDAKIVLPKFETITLLFEIVSAYDIPIGDYTSSDPYVVAYMGHQKVHQTKKLMTTLNPIWTLKTGSLFLLTVDSKRFFVENGMKFVLKDHDQFGKHDVLGIVKVEPKIFYNATGERMEFKLQPPHGSKKESVSGILVIRCRRATEHDQKFMNDYEKQEGAKGVSKYEAPEATTNVIRTITTKVKKKDKETGVTLYKIRPGPDPNRLPEDTEWMTDEELQKSVLEPSYTWVDMGEGDLGKVYVEILGCDGLPNMDSGAFYGNKTDTFVACVYEDVYGRTDIVDDCLSPRWLPWTERAFIFTMSHPSSYLNIGVFDYDVGPLSDHDLIGRVSIDLTNFRSGTEYVLSYNIFTSARVAGRKSEGKVIIRLRMDIFDERKLVLATLRPPRPIYVNTTSKKDFQVMRQTCFGSIYEERYRVETLKSYIDELRELQYAMFYIEDALYTLLLWRGHLEMNVPFSGGKEIKLPLHSFGAFIVSVFLVENPTFLPSFFFGSVAWLLLAIMGWRKNAENVWYHCHSYFAIFKMLGLGDDYAEPHKIDPFENFDKSEKEMEQWVKRIENYDAQAEKDYKQAEEAELERQKELAEIGEADTDLATKVDGGGISLAPVRAALYPIQLMLGIVVRAVRFAKNVVTWQEPFFSFWICTGSLVLALISLFIPWFWCIKWGSRIFVWTIFGPWMKLLDIYYFSLIKPESDEERQFREQAERLKEFLATSEAINEARLLRENAKKMRCMQKYMFGRYALRIPILKQDRYSDIPLAESFATPYKEKDFTLAELAMQEAGYRTRRIPGQTLDGDMIPNVRIDKFTTAPTGHAVANRSKLLKSAPGSAEFTTGLSTVAGGIAASLLITYYGTPMLATIISEGPKWIQSF